MEILRHINKHVFRGGKTIDMSEFDEKKKDDVREHIRVIIVNITKSLNQDKYDQKMMMNNNNML